MTSRNSRNHLDYHYRAVAAYGLTILAGSTTFVAIFSDDNHLSLKFGVGKLIPAELFGTPFSVDRVSTATDPPLNIVVLLERDRLGRSPFGRRFRKLTCRRIGGHRRIKCDFTGLQSGFFSLQAHILRCGRARYWLGFWEIENQRLIAARLKQGDVHKGLSYDPLHAPDSALRGSLRLL